MARALTTPKAIQRGKRAGPVALRRGAQLPQSPPRHGRGVIQNLTVAVTGTTHGAAVISLPRSQVEMTDRHLGWQDRITKVVRRVAIVNEENSEVVRRRLFEDLGAERIRREVARVFSNWCFDRRAQLPPEWTAVDSSLTEVKAREFLQRRFEMCYPFHPTTLSVFRGRHRPSINGRAPRWPCWRDGLRLLPKPAFAAWRLANRGWSRPTSR